MKQDPAEKAVRVVVAAVLFMFALLSMGSQEGWF